MLKKLFFAHLKTNFGYHEDMKGTLVSVKLRRLGAEKLISVSQSLDMSAICTKNARENRLKTQQESPMALLRQPQGNKMPVTGNPLEVLLPLLMRSPSQESQWWKSTAGEPSKRAPSSPPVPPPTHTHTPHTAFIPSMSH